MSQSTDNPNLITEAPESPIILSSISERIQSPDKRSSPIKDIAPKQMNPARIQEYIGALSEFEKSSIAKKNFREAEQAAQRIEELKEQEIEYLESLQKQSGKREQVRLESAYKIEFKVCKNEWDHLINEHLEQIKMSEQEMTTKHQQEIRIFDEAASKKALPKPKFSQKILSIQNFIPKLINAKRYKEAEVLTKNVEKLQKEETEVWYMQLQRKVDKKRELLISQQKTELQVLQGKLENSLHEKLRVRSKEIKKLQQKFVNMRNTLEQQQNQEFAIQKMFNTKSKAFRNITDLTPRNMINLTHVQEKIGDNSLVAQSQTDEDRDS